MIIKTGKEKGNGSETGLYMHCSSLIRGPYSRGELFMDPHMLRLKLLLEAGEKSLSWYSWTSFPGVFLAFIFRASAESSHFTKRKNKGRN